MGRTAEGPARWPGKIRNRTGAGQRVMLVFEAFNGDGQSVASAVATVDFVADGHPAGYEARFRSFSDDGFLNDCDRVARGRAPRRRPVDRSEGGRAPSDGRRGRHPSATASLPASPRDRRNRPAGLWP